MSPRSRPQRYVYSGQLAEAVLQMEQGPQPMKDMRPAKKNPNSTDQFRSDHQAEYENYEAQGSRDSTRNVDKHNAAYPKMVDELEKRRSSARASVPAITAKRRPTNQTTFFDPHCRLCQKLKMAAETKRASRMKSRNEHKKKLNKKSRISKPKRNTRTTFQLCKIRRNIGVQYCDRYTRDLSNDANTSTPSIDDQGINEIYVSNCDDQSNSGQSQATLVAQSQNGSKSDVLTQYPDTSSNNLSSYNSNMSLDHEPMVSR